MSRRRTAGAVAVTLAVVGTAATAGAAHTVAMPAGEDPHPAATQTAHAGPTIRQAASLAERRVQWPVGSRTSTMTFHPDPVSGAPAQRISVATITQDLNHGTISATVRLAAAPTADTDSTVVVAFGRAGNGLCNPTAGSAVQWTAYGLSAPPHLVRDGATMTLRDFPATDARRTDFSCAYAQTWNADFSVNYDAVVNTVLRSTYNRPIFTVGARNLKARPGRWATLKVKVGNKAGSFATAPGVRLSWKGKQIKVRGDRTLGAIRPGTRKTVRLKVRLGVARARKLTLTVRSGDVKKSARVVIRPRR